MAPWHVITELWHYFVVAASMVVAAIAAVHVALHKRDLRAAIGWVAIVCLVPLAGAALYALLGVNRIRRKAGRLRADPRRDRRRPSLSPASPDDTSARSSRTAELVRVVDAVAGRPLVQGNRVVPLIGGDEAYPAMLAAIRAAEHSISVLTFIFDSDAVGREFADALGDAASRGVAVRVLVDAAGMHYSFPTIDRALRRRNVTVRRFMPMWSTRWTAYFNLRNHRKALVVDGQVGFTGGMNIREGHQLSLEPAHPIQDLHFRVEGPVVSQLQQVFVEDWAFTSGELLEGDAWFPRLNPAGEVLARGIADGPDEDYDKLRWTLLGALVSARRSVRIVTPYFLPDATLVSALSLAAMRGVVVDIVLPARCNVTLVQWASWGQMGPVLERGCRVWLTPEPFDHTKLMVVDEEWVLCGSANWDPRSFRLNFELALECHSTELAERMVTIVDDKVARATRMTMRHLDERSFPVRVRDAFARLLSPYL